MKKIEAYLKPFRVPELRSDLARAGFDVILVQQAEEFRPAASYTEVVQGTEYELDVTPRVVLTLLVDDDEVGRALAVIQQSGQTDNPRDGRILVTPIDRCVPVDPAESAEATPLAPSRREGDPTP